MTIISNSTSVLKLNTGAEIPQLALGTWRSTDDEAHNAVLYALKIGYRHIDTAAIYRNERSVGKAIRDSKVPREEIFVTTKLWLTQSRTPAKALDQSLERLGLKYVDLFLMHWPVAMKAPEGVEGDDLLRHFTKENGKAAIDVEEWSFVKTYLEMQKLLDSGKVKAIGVSNFSVKNLETLLASDGVKIIPAANQVELHPLLPQNKLIEFGKKHGILIEAYSPLGSENSDLKNHEKLKTIAKTYDGITTAQLLINWNLKKGNVVLPKSIKEARIEQNFKVFDLEKEDFEKINALALDEGEHRFIVPNFGDIPLFD